MRARGGFPLPLTTGPRYEVMFPALPHCLNRCTNSEQNLYGHNMNGSNRIRLLWRRATDHAVQAEALATMAVGYIRVSTEEQAVKGMGSRSRIEQSAASPSRKGTRFSISSPTREYLAPSGRRTDLVFSASSIWLKHRSSQCCWYGSSTDLLAIYSSVLQP